MSSKAVLPVHQVITSGDMSGTISSTPTIVTTTDNVGYQVVWTGTPTGSFVVEVRNHDSAPWEALTFSPPLKVAAGSADSMVINLNQLPFTQIRLSYTAGSGAGELNAWISGKRLGG